MARRWDSRWPIAIILCLVPVGVSAASASASRSITFPTFACSVTQSAVFSDPGCAFQGRHIGGETLRGVPSFAHAGEPHAGILPPANPPVSVPEVPTYGTGCTYSASPDSSSSCTQAATTATDNARALERIAPISFDIAAFDAMPIAQQLFVISNLERVDRGLKPALYMTTQLNQYARVGVDTRTDPSIPSILTGGARRAYGGSNWASGFESVLHANYFWMYDDGLNSGNVACTATDTAGCWGHRDNILLANPSVGCYLAMGAASTGLAYTEIFVDACGVAPTDQVLTWSHALSALGGSGHLAIATTSLLEPTSFTSSYLQVLQASDGVGPFSWTLTSGALPPGYKLSADGRLSGSLAGPLGVYSFTITLTDSESPPQSVSATYSLTFPGTSSALLGVLAVAGDGQAMVSWAVPANDGGSSLRGYTVTSTPDGLSCSTLGATSCVVTGLVNGTLYTFTVMAVNLYGGGAVSSPSTSVTPMGLPERPIGVSAVAANQRATVSWKAPMSDGGAPIVGYVVTSARGGETCSTTGTVSCVVTGLTNATRYAFTVQASNALGSGPASAPSNLVTPLGSLGAMTVDALSEARGSSTITITITITRFSRTSSARVVGYQVTLNGQRWTNLAPTSLNRFVLRHLRSGARYVLRLRAYDARHEYATSNVVGVVVR